MSSRNPRNHRRLSDGPVRSRSGTLVTLWRWRTEILLIVGTAAALFAVAETARQGSWWSFLVLAGVVSVPAATRSGRNRMTAYFWCLFSRHRIQRVCLETSMHTRTGRIPLILWITPTPAGEKALIATRAGVCAEDFAAHAGEIEAACLAHRVTVSRHPSRANLVAVEIIRRASAEPAYGIGRLYGTARWIPVPRDGERPPDTHTTLPLPRAA